MSKAPRFTVLKSFTGSGVAFLWIFAIWTLLTIYRPNLWTFTFYVEWDTSIQGEWNSYNDLCAIFFYKRKVSWVSSLICLRISHFEPEIMLDGMLNFKIHFMVWYCVCRYEHSNGLLNVWIWTFNFNWV